MLFQRQLNVKISPSAINAHSSSLQYKNRPVCVSTENSLYLSNVHGCHE